ncbi:hypothetical protein DINM_007296 [Dirofilaria immitis]|nr:hypothetical protein [Dirofilaria immitis]
MERIELYVGILLNMNNNWLLNRLRKIPSQTTRRGKKRDVEAAIERVRNKTIESLNRADQTEMTQITRQTNYLSHESKENCPWILVKVYQQQQEDEYWSIDKLRNCLRKTVRIEEVVQIQTCNSRFDKRPVHRKINQQFRETESGESSDLAVAD